MQYRFRNTICLLAVVSGLLSGCENPLDLPLRKDEFLLTLNAEINPDEPVVALLTFPKRPFESGPFEVPRDASIQLYEDDTWLETLSYNPNDTAKTFGIYAGKIRPEAGKSYRLEVQYPGYTPLKAVETMPSRVSVSALETIYYPADFEQDGEARFSLSFDDHPGEANYYLLYVFYRTLVVDPNEPGSQGNYEFFTGSRSLNLSEAEFDYSGGILFSDATFNGNSAVLQIQLSAEPLSLFQDPRYKEASLFFELRRISKNNFLYRQSLTRFLRDNNDGFSEPVMVWNNIEGGLGIFSSFTRSFKEVKLK